MFALFFPLPRSAAAARETGSGGAEVFVCTSVPGERLLQPGFENHTLRTQRSFSCKEQEHAPPPPNPLLLPLPLPPLMRGSINERCDFKKTEILSPLPKKIIIFFPNMQM